MNFFSVLAIEFKKIRRSKILLILIIPIIVLWVPMIINADMNFSTGEISISPENNFMIQSFMGFAWFMFPASIVVSTVLLTQTENKNNGLLKMLSLPISSAELCAAKFAVLLTLALFETLFMIAAYFLSGFLCSAFQNYNFTLPFMTVLKFSGLLYLSAIPTAALYMFFSIVIKSPVFAVGIGLATIVPSVLIINTNAWIGYLPSYPFYLITVEYAKVASHMTKPAFDAAVLFTVGFVSTLLLLIMSCLLYTRHERR